MIIFVDSVYSGVSDGYVGCGSSYNKSTGIVTLPRQMNNRPTVQVAIIKWY